MDITRLTYAEQLILYRKLTNQKLDQLHALKEAIQNNNIEEQTRLTEEMKELSDSLKQLELEIKTKEGKGLS